MVLRPFRLLGLQYGLPGPVPERELLVELPKLRTARQSRPDGSRPQSASPPGSHPAVSRRMPSYTAPTAACPPPGPAGAAVAAAPPPVCPSADAPAVPRSQPSSSPPPIPLPPAWETPGRSAAAQRPPVARAPRRPHPRPPPRPPPVANRQAGPEIRPYLTSRNLCPQRNNHRQSSLIATRLSRDRYRTSSYPAWDADAYAWGGRCTARGSHGAGNAPLEPPPASSRDCQRDFSTAFPPPRCPRGR